MQVFFRGGWPRQECKSSENWWGIRKAPELTDRATHEFFQAIILSTPAVPWDPRDEGFSRGFERGAAMVELVGFIKLTMSCSAYLG